MSKTKQIIEEYDWDRLWLFYKPPYRGQVTVTPGWVAAVYVEGERIKAEAAVSRVKADKFDALEFSNGERLNRVSQAVSGCIEIIIRAGVEVKEGTIAHQLMTVLEAAPLEGNK